ncbi:MAG: hypothetical protein ACTSWY_14060 [Promethearchaeota archaeon]
MWHITIPVWLFFFGVFFVYITIRKAKSGNQDTLINEIFIVSLFFISGVLLLYPTIFVFSIVSNQTRQLLNIITTIFIIGEMLFLFKEILTEYLRCKKDPKLIDERSWQKYTEKRITALKNLDLNNSGRKLSGISSSDISRKILHMIPPIVILVFLGLSNILNEAGLLAQWNIDVIGFAYWLIMTIGMAFVLMFATGDLCRLTDKYYLLPNWAQNWYGSGLNMNEWDTFMGTIPIVLSLVPFFFTELPIFISVVLITTLADASAALIGKGFGKHKLSMNTDKSVEGHIAGGITSFLIVLIVMNLFGIGLIKSTIMAIVATLLFLIVDRFATKISDNILNPLVCGLGLIAVFFIIS